jgi:hypothetical protein
MQASRRRTARRASMTLVGLVLAGALAMPSSFVSAGAATVARPEGAGPPVAASGMGTQAALDNPRCRHDDPKYGPYGRFDTTALGGFGVFGGGPPCVKVWEKGANNGGATSRGVTKDRIKVVFVLPNEEQFKTDPVKPVNRTTNGTGTYQDGLHDYLIPTLRFYETWGRDLEVHFYTSTGTDEQAQRADIVAITAMKPFAVNILISGFNLKVLETGLASAKILTWGYTSSYADSAKASPYLWGSADNNATAINSAEVLGKQLVGKKAEFAGKDVAGQTRKLGVVSDGSIDDSLFADHLRSFGGKVTTTATIPVDPDAIQSAVPTIITKLKSAGITTIVVFTGSGGVQALMEAASKQDYFPEWFFTGASYQDIGILVRNYPPEQAQHAFGISFIPPSTKPDPETEATTDFVTWYWGRGVGTFSGRYLQAGVWLLSGIQAAGPNLTPKTFKQGLFAIPATDGAASGRNDGFMVGWAKTPKLPWDEYAISGYDFAPYWWDPTTEGASNGLYIVGKGVGWYPDGAKRYVATTWPKKQFAWFDKAGAIQSFDSRPGGPPEYAGDCTNCPAHGGPGQPGSPSDSVVVFKAGGTGASAA